MKLPLSFSKEQKKEFFLALVLRNEKVNAVFMEEVGGKIHVLSKHAEIFGKSIEESSTEELLETADKAISQAEERLPEKLETVKTIFGVKGSWVEDNKIKKDYLAKLKKISDELGLVPIGFLVIFEAIAYLLEKEEGTPVSAILVETGQKFVSAALIKGGKIKEFKTSEITTSPAVTLDNVLKHFSSDVLPPKIVVFNGEEDESQEFLNHKWSQGLSFIQIPQVTTLSSEFDARAVLFGAATQLGFEVLDEKLPEDDDEIPADFNDKPLEKTEDNTDIQTIPEDSVLENFGFIKDKDIAKVPLPKTTEKIEKVPEEVLEEQIKEIPEEVAIEEGEKRQLPVNAAAMMSAGGSILSKAAHNLRKIPLKNFLSLPMILVSGGKLTLIPLAILIFLVVGGFFYLFSNKAAVVLNISARPTEKTQDVTFSADSSTDASAGILASQFFSVTQEGEVSANTTGKKDVGEKAKGKVTIFNSGDSSQKLSEGAAIKSSGDLSFTLDKEVTVPAASGDVFSGTTPGKVDVAVTAKDIGTESNLPSDTKFSIGSNSTMAAKNDTAFSGGSKKEVKVVSSVDIKKLEEKLPKDLEGKGREDLKKKIKDDEELLEGFVGQTLVKKTLSKKVDEEADRVTLKGTVEYKGISYKKSDLVTFANEILKNEISDDEMINPDNLRTAVGNAEEDDENINAKLAIKGFIIPKFKNEEIAKSITGKSFSSAEEILKKLPQVSSAEIKLSFSIPGLPKLVPFSSKNIKIMTETNE